MDASTSCGIGGFAGDRYFMLRNSDLQPLFSFFNYESKKDLMHIPKNRLPIAYIELIAVLVGFSVFAKYQENTVIRLYTDNTDVVG